MLNYVVICIFLKIDMFFMNILVFYVIFFVLKIRIRYSTIFLIKDLIGGGGLL